MRRGEGFRGVNTSRRIRRVVRSVGRIRRRESVVSLIIKVRRGATGGRVKRIPGTTTTVELVMRIVGRRRRRSMRCVVATGRCRGMRHGTRTFPSMMLRIKGGFRYDGRTMRRTLRGRMSGVTTAFGVITLDLGVGSFTTRVITHAGRDDFSSRGGVVNRRSWRVVVVMRRGRPVSRSWSWTITGISMTGRDNVDVFGGPVVGVAYVRTVVRTSVISVLIKGSGRVVRWHRVRSRRVLMRMSRVSISP